MIAYPIQTYPEHEYGAWALTWDGLEAVTPRPDDTTSPAEDLSALQPDHECAACWRYPDWERYSDLAPLGAVLMSTVSDFVRLTVQRKCPFGWSLMVDDAAPWRPGGPPARTYLLMVLREMPSSRAVARIESPCRRAC